MNYFELYQIPISFLPDTAAVKRKYFTLSKEYHPDFYSTQSQEKQASVLEMSAQVNQGYNILMDFDKRMKYILMLQGYLEEEEKFVLPQSFLMEMMDLNEQLMEVKMSDDAEALAEIKNTIQTFEQQLYKEIEPVLSSFTIAASADVYQQIKAFYYKRKYLLRIGGVGV